MAQRDYDDIPGTYVFDGRRAAAGYAINKACMSLNVAENRDRFRADPDGYLDEFGLTDEQKAAVVNRDWLGMLELGGNFYLIFKLATLDGTSMQEVGAAMTGVTPEEFGQMMRDGGRVWNG